MLRMFKAIATAVMVLLPFAGAKPAMAKTGEPGPVTIGALYVNTPTGARYREGIAAALHAHPFGAEVAVRDFVYSNEKQGVELLAEVLARGDVDLVIGPTESGVFARALKDRAELEKHKIPVISSLVTVDVPHQEYGWFFRTNVNLKRRAHAIYDFLNKYWVRSVALLYADTELGLKAEAAFRQQLRPSQRVHYMPLLYSDSPLDARAELRQVLDSRPEAVGIFGERKDIRHIYESLDYMNDSSNPYQPIFFSLIDARHTGGYVDDIHFVSVTPTEVGETPDGGRYDDVKALAHDTTLLALDELEALPAGLPAAARRQAFRDSFEAVLRSGARRPGLITDLTMAGFENITTPSVLHLDGHKLVEMNLRQAVGIADKAVKKYELLIGRFGPTPFFNLLLLLAIVLVVSIADVKKWYAGNGLALFHYKNYPFYLLLGTNALTVLCLYVFMGETGRIRYDSTLAAIAVAMLPIAVMRMKLFETSAGKEIGLDKFYESFLQWINDRLMLIKHRETKLYVHLIAYNNSVDGMKSYLREIYRNSRSVAQRIRLTTELDQRINDSLSHLERRKACARLLLRTVPWDQLQEDGLAPQGEADEMEDPEMVIRKAARHCASRPAAQAIVDDAIEGQLERYHAEPDRKKELEATLARELKDVVGFQGRLRRMLTHLFVVRGCYEEAYLESLGLLPRDDQPEPVDPTFEIHATPGALAPQSAS